MKQKMKQEKKTEPAIKLTLTELQARYLWWYLNTTGPQDLNHANDIISYHELRGEELLASATQVLRDPRRVGCEIWEKLDDALMLAHIEPYRPMKG